MTSKKPPKDTRRTRDSHVKQDRSKEAADNFVEHLSTHPGKGAVTNAAKAAYPNQATNSAANTGSKLLKDPYVQEQIRLRQHTVRQMANVQREDLVGNLMLVIFASLDDVMGDNGHIDWEKARDRGIAHLIQEVKITDRHSKDGSARTTTEYKLPSKLHAMDLLAEMTGWKREPQKNPIDLARATYAIMRQNERYRDVSDAELARFPAEKFKVGIAEILEGQKL